MTPALKAMVEAMAAEIERETDAAWLGEDGHTLSMSVEGGHFDLEKVAQAGLEAIPLDVLARAIYALDPQTEPGDPFEPSEPLNGVRALSWDECDSAYCEAATADAKSIRDAILGEKP